MLTDVNKNYVCCNESRNTTASFLVHCSFLLIFQIHVHVITGWTLLLLQDLLDLEEEAKSDEEEEEEEVHISEK